MYYPDGTTNVTITDEGCDRDDGGKLWSGALHVTSGIVTLSDSGAFQYINLPTPTGHRCSYLGR